MSLHRVSLRPVGRTSLPLILQPPYASPRRPYSLPLLRRHRSLLRTFSTTSLPNNITTERLPRPYPTTAPRHSSTSPKTTITLPPQQQPPRPPKSLTRYALPALTLLLALDFLFTNIFQLMTVTGPSMYPFLNTDAASSLAASSSSKDTVFVSLVQPAQDLRRGHVVAFYSPLQPEVMAVKRVVAVGGDVVEVRGREGTVRGVSGARGKRQGEKKERPTVVVVPPGHVWVEGEHPEGNRWSVDSNTYGPVPVGLLVGRVEAVVWPWARRGWIRWQDWRGSGRVKEGRDMEKMVEVEVFGLE